MKKKFLIVTVLCLLALPVILLTACDSSHTFTADDFALHVMVEQDTLPQGQNFGGIIQIQNRTERNVTIAFFVTPIWPYISGWEFPIAPFDMPRYPEFFRIEGNGYWQGTWGFGDDLELGFHELTFSTIFYINWGRRNQKSIGVVSNIVVLTVI